MVVYSSMPGQGQNVFYQLANGDIPSKTVYEDDNVRGILDTHPARKGHVLLLPKKQIQVSPQMDEETARSMSEAVKTMSERALKAFDIGGTSIFIANGGVAGQKAPHLLVHLIPRKEQDNVGLRPKPKKIPKKEYEEVKNRLLSALGQDKQRSKPREDSSDPHTSSGSDDVDFEKIERMFR